MSICTVNYDNANVLSSASNAVQQRYDAAITASDAAHTAYTLRY
jgi:hypothetical protein